MGDAGRAIFRERVLFSDRCDYRNAL